MPKEFQSLKSDFLHAMKAEVAWPQEKVIKQWFQQHDLPYRNGTFHNLRSGDALDSTYCINFARCMIAKDGVSHTREMARTREFLFAYLKTHDCPSPDSVTPQELVMHVFNPPTERPQRAPESRDWFSLGIPGLISLFPLKRRVEDHVLQCDDKLLRESVTWIYDQVGSQSAKVKSGSPQALEAAEAKMRIKIDAYTRLAMAWRQRHPWIVVCARGAEKPTGVSIILPVSEKTYQRVLDGKQMMYECDPAEFVIPSRHLLFEALTTRPSGLGGEPERPSTKSLLWCALAQGAVLSRFTMTKDGQPIRLLSFAGSPQSADRLRIHKYRRVGKRMGDTEIELYERTLSPEARGYDFLFASMVATLSQSLVEPPRS